MTSCSQQTCLPALYKLKPGACESKGRRSCFRRGGFSGRKVPLCNGPVEQDVIFATDKGPIYIFFKSGDLYPALDLRVRLKQANPASRLSIPSRMSKKRTNCPPKHEQSLRSGPLQNFPPEEPPRSPTPHNLCPAYPYARDEPQMPALRRRVIDFHWQYMNEDASEQYDRQIRLWGVEAQQRMSGSKVLFSGINGVSGVWFLLVFSFRVVVKDLRGPGETLFVL